MKTTLLLVSTLLASCFFTGMAAQELSGLTLVNSLKMKGASHVTLHLEGDVDLEYWDENYLFVEVDIKSDNLSGRQLRSLANLGFFQVKLLGNADGVALGMPGQALPVKVNGTKPGTAMTFSVKVPRYTSVERYSESEGLLAMEPASR